MTTTGAATVPIRSSATRAAVGAGPASEARSGAFGDEDRAAHAAAQRTAHRDVERAQDGPGHAVPEVGRAGLADFPGDQGAAARRGPDVDVPAGRVGEPQPRRLGVDG